MHDEDADGPPTGGGSGPAAGPAAAAAARARAAVERAVRALAEASARTETLAEFVPGRRVLGMPRAPRMRVVGPVWRLGVLLLDSGGRLYSLGRVVRAEKAVRRSVLARSVAEQRAYRAAAIRGGIPEGASVVFDAVALDLDVDALLTRPGALVLTTSVDGSAAVGVRWNPTSPDAVLPLESYLAERVDLLAHPPQGA